MQNLFLQVGWLQNAKKMFHVFESISVRSSTAPGPKNLKNGSQMMPKSMKNCTLRAPAPSLSSWAPRGVPWGGLFSENVTFLGSPGVPKGTQNLICLLFFRRGAVLFPLLIGVPFSSSILSVSGAPPTGKTSNSAAEGRHFLKGEQTVKK